MASICVYVMYNKYVSRGLLYRPKFLSLYVLKIKYLDFIFSSHPFICIQDQTSSTWSYIAQDVFLCYQCRVYIYSRSSKGILQCSGMYRVTCYNWLTNSIRPIQFQVFLSIGFPIRCDIPLNALPNACTCN